MAGVERFPPFLIVVRVAMKADSQLASADEDDSPK